MDGGAHRSGKRSKSRSGNRYGYNPGGRWGDVDDVDDVEATEGAVGAHLGGVHILSNPHVADILLSVTGVADEHSFLVEEQLAGVQGYVHLSGHSQIALVRLHSSLAYHTALQESRAQWSWTEVMVDT